MQLNDLKVKIVPDLMHDDKCSLNIPWAPPENVISCCSQILPGYKNVSEIPEVWKDHIPPGIQKFIQQHFDEVKEIRKIEAHKEISNLILLIGVSLAYIEQLKFDARSFHYFYDHLAAPEKNTFAPFVLPWKGLASDKSQLFKFLAACVRALNDKDDLFSKEEHFPQRINKDKKATLLNVFLGLGISIMRNASDSIPNLLTTDMAVGSYFRQEKPIEGVEFYQAMARAFKIRLTIYDCRKDKYRQTTEQVPADGPLEGLRTINVVLMDESLLLVYSWSRNEQIDILSEAINDSMKRKSKELASFIATLEEKLNEHY